jgi:hypothetical protein
MNYDLSTAEGRTALRTAWIEALRSGKYKQTKEKLRSRNGAMCCLGVLCDVAGLKKEYRNGHYYYSYGNDEDSMELPDEFAEAFGMQNISGVFPKVEGQRFQTIRPKGVETDSLIQMNDDGKYTFKDIADVIEKHPELIFKDVQTTKVD